MMHLRKLCVLCLGLSLVLCSCSKNSEEGQSSSDSSSSSSSSSFSSSSSGGVSVALSGSRHVAAMSALDTDGDFLVIQRPVIFQDLLKNAAQFSPCFTRNFSGLASGADENVYREIQEALGLSCIKRMGLSSKHLSDGKVQIKTVAEVDSSARGLMLDLFAGENKSFVLLDSAPKNAWVVLERYVGAGEAWQDFLPAWEKLVPRLGLDSKLGNLPRTFDQQCRQMTGKDAATMLSSVQGMWSLVVLPLGSNVKDCGFCLSLPDHDGVLLATLQRMGVVNQAGTALMVPLPFVEQGGKLVRQSGRLVFYSSARAEQAMCGGLKAWLAEEGYTSDFMDEGTNYLFVRVPSQLLEELTELNMETVTDATGKHETPVLCGFGRRSSTGFCHVFRSNYDLLALGKMIMTHYYGKRSTAPASKAYRSYRSARPASSVYRRSYRSARPASSVYRRSYRSSRPRRAATAVPAWRY